MDVALAASFVLAFPLAWLCNEMVGWTNTTISVNGQLLEEPDKTVRAALMSSATPPPLWPEATPVGVFLLEVNDVYHGWPLTTKVSRQAARLHLDLRTEGRPRPDAQLDANDPIRIAIVESLARDGQSEALAAWPAGAARPRTAILARQPWISWIVASGLWWIMLTFGSAIVIHSANLVVMVVRGKRAVRRARFQAEGRCLACGYDLTGLEFHARCPECGELVW